ncbi:hypothetical protein H1Q63_34610 [Desmonostoc muscorum CCALA 125]|nr:hypothetical protein [Desmonostoc muscorum CCALA 125]
MEPLHAILGYVLPIAKIICSYLFFDERIILSDRFSSAASKNNEIVSLIPDDRQHLAVYPHISQNVRGSAIIISLQSNLILHIRSEDFYSLNK